MAYDLDAFNTDTRRALQTQPLAAALDAIADALRRLLAEPAFVASAFHADTPPGKRELHHDAETDFHVLAHVQEANKGGAPHSHGESWAIYGTADGVTEMTEYARVNPETEEAVVLKVSDRYALRPGEVRGYGPGAIHSTAHPGKTWVVRITGTDLDHVARYRFKRARDRVLEEA